MIRFWKENSSLIVKLMITQFGMAVFGLLLNSAASMSENTVLVVIFSVFSVIFYLFLLYTAVWDFGAKDKLKIEGKRLAPRPLHGLWVSLYANIPNLLLSAVATVAYLIIDKSVTNADGAFIQPVWAVNLFAVAHVIGSYLASVYMGITETIGIVGLPFTVALCTLPSLAACALGYWFGTKERFPIVPEKNAGKDF